jgi:hypothetical protein
VADHSPIKTIVPLSRPTDIPSFLATQLAPRLHHLHHLLGAPLLFEKLHLSEIIYRHVIAPIPRIMTFPIEVVVIRLTSVAAVPSP